MKFTTNNVDNVKVINLKERDNDVEIIVNRQYVAFFDSKDATLTVFTGKLKEHGLTLYVSE